MSNTTRHSRGAERGRRTIRQVEFPSGDSIARRAVDHVVQQRIDGHFRACLGEFDMSESAVGQRVVRRRREVWDESESATGV